MKTIITAIFFILASLKIIAKDDAIWLKNIEKAKQVSCRNKNLIILVVKDKSKWGQKLEKLVVDYSTKENKAALYTFCTIDEKEFIKEDLNPTLKIILMHPKYGVIANMGYLPFEVKEFDNYLNSQIKNFETIKDVALNVKNFDSKELEKTYLLSKQMGCSAFQTLIQEEGNNRSDTAFFSFERYEMLIHKFSYDDERVKIARKEVEEKDYKNIQKYHLKLAMLDFLNLAKEDKALSLVIQPLVYYINLYGEKDKKNLWKVYMTISQFFLGKKEYSKALEYARLSNKKAPRSVKKHIQSSIKYLRRKIIFKR
jgi:hypothetical protein